MKLAEKQDLIRLLNLYQAELLEHNEKNAQEATKHEHKWEGDYYFGVRAKYNHARIIAASLAVEIGKTIEPY